MAQKENILSTLFIIILIVIVIYYLSTPENKNAVEPANNADNQVINKSVKRVHFNDIPNDNPDHDKTNDEVSNIVFNFQPDDTNQIGADLNMAYDKPLPPNTNTDEVDINKNNVKKYNAKDFLPKEINNDWFDTDFSQAKYNINDDKLINTERYIIGINTVGQSLKNASYDIRGTVPNPKFSISPWNNSTYEPDFNLKPLC